MEVKGWEIYKPRQKERKKKWSAQQHQVFVVWVKSCLSLKKFYKLQLWLGGGEGTNNEVKTLKHYSGRIKIRCAEQLKFIITSSERLFQVAGTFDGTPSSSLS